MYSVLMRRVPSTFETCFGLFATSDRSASLSLSFSLSCSWYAFSVSGIGRITRRSAFVGPGQEANPIAKACCAVGLDEFSSRGKDCDRQAWGVRWLARIEPPTAFLCWCGSSIILRRKHRGRRLIKRRLRSVQKLSHTPLDRTDVDYTARRGVLLH